MVLSCVLNVICVSLSVMNDDDYVIVTYVYVWYVCVHYTYIGCVSSAW